LSERLRALGVEERFWPGRDDDFANLFFEGRELAHFHHWTEIDIRLGKEVIKRERLVHPANSKVHPGRAQGSPWYEMTIENAADADEVLRLLQIALSTPGKKK